MAGLAGLLSLGYIPHDNYNFSPFVPSRIEKRFNSRDLFNLLRSMKTSHHFADEERNVSENRFIYIPNVGGLVQLCAYSSVADGHLIELLSLSKLVKENMRTSQIFYCDIGLDGILDAVDVNEGKGEQRVPNPGDYNRRFLDDVNNIGYFIQKRESKANLYKLIF